MTTKTKMTKEEMVLKIEELTKANENLVKSQGETVRSKIMTLIDDGVNSIEELGSLLSINSKNVSSNLTKIRAELKESGRTIVTQRIEKRTMLAIVNFKDLNW